MEWRVPDEIPHVWRRNHTGGDGGKGGQPLLRTLITLSARTFLAFLLFLASLFFPAPSFLPLFLDLPDLIRV
jgi:hypothetical protein